MANPDTLPADFFKGKQNPDTLPGDFKGGKIVSSSVTPIDQGPGRGGRKVTQEQVKEASQKGTTEDLRFGVPRLSTGLEQLTNVGGNRPDQRLKGAHNTLIGAGQLASPLAIPTSAAAIPAVMGSAAMGLAGGKAARGVASLAGVKDEDILNLLEDAGMVAGGAEGSSAGVRRAIGDLIPAKARNLGRAMVGRGPALPESTTADVSGDTFHARNKLRELGGKWDKERQVWTVPAEKLQTAKDAVAKVPKLKVESGYRSRGERGPEDIAGSQPSRGPLQSPKSGVDARKPSSGEAQGIADVLKKIGTTKAEAGTMSPLEWKLVFSNAKLKDLPHPDVLKDAIGMLE